MKKINIQIDQPCSEDYKTFNKTDEGGFCKSCKKNVIDFTKMNDKEIFNFFTNENNKTCGIFLESQLKSYANPSLASNRTMSNSFSSCLFGLSLVSLLSLTNVYSQEQKTNTNTIVKEENSATKKDTNSEDQNEKFTVSGIVSDGIIPLPGANIYLKNYNISTQTDIDGKFTFPKQLEAGDILLVTYIGYKEKEIKVTRENQSIKMNYSIKLDNCQIVMMGEVATNKVYQSKRTLFQKIKSLFTNE
ncbi:carboxypeptidase-like regulatory domain-containing protein [Flavobacterium chungnamense]|uniref:Carboxypeptidase-like regulatory domain-containing protein n=1 Tax=Flavobacterium chungnamense TaxID=706182 RepID=A0ABP7UZ30_9FLAO